MIYHITTQANWKENQNAGFYKPTSFDQEGFIHCSDSFQIEGTANRYYLDAPDLIVLEIDPDKSASKVIYEKSSERAMSFPHLYGPLELTAVRGMIRLIRDSEGRWTLPAQLQRAKPPLINEIPFSLPGKLYRTVTPGSYMFDPDSKVIDLLKERRVEWAVVLNTIEEHEKYTGASLLARYALEGIQTIYTPVPDFSAPPSGHWNKAILEALELLKQGKNIAVHCHAGIGRTGIFLACMAQEQLAMSADEAISWVRQFIPGAVETLYQIQFVRNYQNHR